jgi:ribonuclease P/MRP protein subunit POP5
MEKIKAVLPSLREKKRYLVFEVISDKPIEPSTINEAIKDSYKELYGQIGLSSAGLLFINKRFNKEKQRGVVKVSNKYVEKLRFSLSLIKKIEQNKVIVRSVGCSGILKKAEKNYLL